MRGEGHEVGSVLDSVGHGEDIGFYAESPWRVLSRSGTGSDLYFNTLPPSQAYPRLPTENGLQGSKEGSREVSEEATATVLAGEARAGWEAVAEGEECQFLNLLQGKYCCRR